MTPWERIVQNHSEALDIKKLAPVRTPTKQCTFCKKFLSNDDFYSKADNIGGLRSRCKACYIKARNKNVVS